MGRLRPASSAASVSSSRTSRRGVVKGADHHRERLVATLLAFAQHRHGRLAGRVTGEVVAADALDRHDRTVAQQSSCCGQRLLAVRRIGSRIGEAQLRPTVGAAHRLGVEPAVRRVVVLPRACAAHVEVRHRRAGAVIGQAGRDGEPRSAVGARDEGVPVAAVGRVVQVGQAVIADRDVGWHERATRCMLGLLDREVRAADRGDRLRVDAGDQRQRRCLDIDPAAESLDVGQSTFDLGHHSLAAVPHAPRETELAGQGIDMWPEADSLHDAAHDHTTSRVLRPGGSRGEHAHSHRIPWRNGCRVGPASSGVRARSVGPTRQSNG